MKEEKEEARKEIVVLDEGVDPEEMLGPQVMCCFVLMGIFF